MMSDLVLEFYSEEIPSNMQVKAARDLKNLFENCLIEERLPFRLLEAFSTPRRLALIIWDLADVSDSFFEEKKGPRVGAPEKALSGFAKSMNLAVSDLYVKQEKKGDFYFHRIEHSGISAEHLIKEITIKIASNFPWKKSMRWGSSSFRWVRPLRTVLCALYRVNQEPKRIDFELNGVLTGTYTYGHSVMCPGKVYPKTAQDYIDCLRDRKVILDPKEREDIIWDSAKKLADEKKLVILKDKALLAEIAGLVEWPVVMIGDIDKEFLDLPAEILQVSMREHQKFFSVLCADNKEITKFIVVSNIKTKDTDNLVLAGNIRVLRSRLRDANFFYQKDLADIESKKFSALNSRLKAVTFHNKIGSQAHRVEGIRKISVRIAKLLGTDPQTCDQAAKLCKTDLTTKVVGEFPELQGIVGGLYSKIEGQKEVIHKAVTNHYQPVTQNDKVPQEIVTTVVAIADRIFTLTAFWEIGEKPSGSKDPFALRRNAIGLIRILIEKQLNLELRHLIGEMLSFEKTSDLSQFLCERFRILLIEKGFMYDTLQACLVGTAFNDPYSCFVKVEQLEKFRKIDLFDQLMDAYRRPNNILISEENKTNKKYDLEPKINLFSTDEEKNLFEALLTTEDTVKKMVSKNDYQAALQALASLHGSVDAFFENVTINSESIIKKENRLCLCNKVRHIMHFVARFSEVKMVVKF